MNPFEGDIYMRLTNQEITDKKLIKAVLDMCDVINIAFFDEEYPYNLPVNFGYEFEEDLIFYCHHASGGYKIKLVENNPKVCVVTHKFLDHKDGYDSSSYEYRSVMAFGEISFVPTGSDEYVKAWQCICACNERPVPDVIHDENMQKRLQLTKIVCRADKVFAKAQRKITSVEEIPFRCKPG